MTTQKTEGIIWGIICLLMLVIAVLHPRIIYWIMVIVYGIRCIICYRATSEKTVGRLCRDVIENIIVILILCYLGQYLNIMFPYHAGYEYKKDIAALKADSFKEYYYFPDEIPAAASDVKWKCMPGFLQGSGYNSLFFSADESYLQNICNAYSEEATIYRYTEYAWVDNDTGKSAEFPDESGIDEAERKNVEVFILYDNHDIDHLHNGGFYINQTKGYICFFAQ